MTTVINTPANSDGGSGWAVTVVILLAILIIGGYFWFNSQKAAPAPKEGASINVTLPTGSSDAGTSSN